MVRGARLDPPPDGKGLFGKSPLEKHDAFEIVAEGIDPERLARFRDVALGDVVFPLRYRLHQNGYGLTGIAFRFDAQGNMTLTLESASAIHNIPFGLDDWQMGSTDRTFMFAGTTYANSMNTTPVTTAGWCCWTAPDELGAYYLSLFNNGCQERFRFSFSPDRDELTITFVAPEQRRFPGNQAPVPSSRDIVLTASRIKTTY